LAISGQPILPTPVAILIEIFGCNVFQIFPVEVSVDAQYMPLQKLFDLSISRSHITVNLSRFFDGVDDFFGDVNSNLHLELLFVAVYVCIIAVWAILVNRILHRKLQFSNKKLGFFVAKNPH
jgi:hypothetical protein